MRQFKFLGDADMSCIDITTVALRSLHRLFFFPYQEFDKLICMDFLGY